MPCKPQLIHRVLIVTLLAVPALGRGLTEPEILEWPPALAGGPFTQVAVARITGGDHRHVVVLCGRDPVLLYEPASFESFTEVPSATHTSDFGVLRLERSALQPDRDVLILARDEGLDLVGFRDGSWQLQPIDHGASFQGSVLMRVADLDGDQRDDLVVLAADRRTVRVKRQQPDGAFVDGPNGPIVFAQDVSDLAVLEFDGDASPEIAADTSLGIKIMNQDGTQVTGYRSYKPTLDCMTVLRGSGGALDQVLWCTATNANPNSTAQNLVLVNNEEAPVQSQVNVNIVSLASGQFDVDPQPDVVATVRSEDQMIFFYAQPTGPMFTMSGDAFYSIPLTTAGGAQGAARPLVADLTSDGLDDVLVPVNESQKVVLVAGMLSLTQYGGTSLPDFMPGGATCYDPLGTGDATVFPEVLFSGIGLNYHDSLWRLETEVFILPNGASTLTSNPTSYCRDDLDFFPHANDAGTENEDSLEVGLDCESIDARSFFFYIRLVRLDSAGSINLASPALLGGISKTGALDELLYPGWPAIVPVEVCASLGGGLRINGFSRIRRFPPGTPNFNPIGVPCHSRTHGTSP